MGSEDASTRDPRLRLERETLRDLSPTESDAATVRGGDDDLSYTGGKEQRCEPPMYEAVRALLGQTSITLGCSGTFTVRPLDGGHEISFNIEPTQEMKEIQLQMLRRFEQQ